MIDNSKEYIVCAAYKTIKDTPHLKYLTDKGSDVKNIFVICLLFVFLHKF